MTLGEELRKARAARGITIEQLSAITKISPAILNALEADDAARLPGWVFTRGFLRSYAREVGLDPGETVARFLEQFVPPAQPSSSAASPSRPEREDDEMLEESEHRFDLGQMVAIAVIVVAAIGYVGLHKRSTSASASAAAPIVATATVPTATTPAEMPVGTSGVAATPAQGLKMDIEAKGPCWIGATADGSSGMQRLMNAGERTTITAREQLILRVGDPAALSFSLNGATGRSLGSAGQPVTLRITTQNYRDYLAS